MLTKNERLAPETPVPAVKTNLKPLSLAKGYGGLARAIPPISSSSVETNPDRPRIQRPRRSLFVHE